MTAMREATSLVSTDWEIFIIGSLDSLGQAEIPRCLQRVNRGAQEVTSCTQLAPVLDRQDTFVVNSF